MDIPDLVREALGGEDVEAGVNLGDEDAVVVTPTRTILYRAEGLLSDESVEEFPHDVERLEVREGRRKTKFVLEYVGDTRSFSVPGNRADRVLQLLLGGILRAGDVLDPGESVLGAYRFSELTLLIAEKRVVRHIGAAVWDDDFEEYAYGDVTGLDFERGSVATQIVIEVDGRPQRIKAPNEEARVVQQQIEEGIFDYHGVASLEELNAAVATDEDGDDVETSASGGSGMSLDSGIDPLVSETPEEEDDDESVDTVRSREPRSTGSADAAASEGADADLAAVRDQLDELTSAVERQNELLTRQQRTVKQLIEELRQGR